MAAPTLISYGETAWTTTGTPKTVASVAWQTGDVIVVLGAAEVNDNFVLVTPTATGLTFTKNQNLAGTGGTDAQAYVATAVAGSADTQTVSGTVTGTQSGTYHWGFGVWVWRGSAGVGNSSSQRTATKTVSQTNTAANAGMVWGIFDFNADGALSGTPSPTTTRQSFDDGTRWSAGVFDLADQTSAGAVSYGGTGGGTTGRFAIVVQEIKAGAGATTWGPLLGNQNNRLVVAQP